jgi:peptide/nickel transport system permease protein
MMQNPVKRLVLFVISLSGIIIIGFYLTRAIPGDPVKRMLGVANPSEAGKNKISSHQYDELYYKLGYHLPVFYFTWSSLAVPDSFYHLPQHAGREQLISLSAITGNPSGVYSFRKSLEHFSDDINFSKENNSEEFYKLKLLIGRLKSDHNLDSISILLSANHWLIDKQDTITVTKYRNLEDTVKQLVNRTQTWKRWIPVIGINSDNQFHRWLFGGMTEQNGGVIHGDLGNSTVTNKKVSEIIFKPFKLTLLISLLALVISLIIAIPIAVWLTVHRQTTISIVIPEVLLFIYSIPGFFTATLLLLLFANPSMLNIFPTGGIAPIGGYPSGSGYFYQLWHSIPFFILPLIAYTLGSIVFFIRLLQTSLTVQLATDYFRTALAKGVSEKKIIATHALRNSLIPLLTIGSSAIPAMISGAVILENIFSIPGMGTVLVSAVMNQDYPVLNGFFLLVGLVTILVFTITDFLYSRIDPRINFDKKN